jgi:hypothetical protein
MNTIFKPGDLIPVGILSDSNLAWSISGQQYNRFERGSFALVLRIEINNGFLPPIKKYQVLIGTEVFEILKIS